MDKFSEKHVPVLLPCFHTIGLPCVNSSAFNNCLEQDNSIVLCELEIVELLSDEKEDEAIVYCGECEEGVSVAIARCNHENCGIELCDFHLTAKEGSSNGGNTY